MTNEEEKIPCKWCDEPSLISGADECNRCWEVTSRLDNFLKSQKARDFTRQLLLKREEIIYFQYTRDPFATESKKVVEKEYKNYCKRIQPEGREPLNFDEWYGLTGYLPVKR